jgi:hypothetical protein
VSGAEAPSRKRRMMAASHTEGKHRLGALLEQGLHVLHGRTAVVFSGTHGGFIRHGGGVDLALVQQLKNCWSARNRTVAVAAERSPEGW